MITNIIDQLKRDESERASAYDDADGAPISAGTTVKGFVTVGIGTCIDASRGCGLTNAEMEYLAVNRITLAAADIRAQFPWTSAMDSVRFGVLMNMCYQMGIDGLAKFKQALAAMQAENWPEASVQMLDSTWAKVQSPARAQRLATQIVTGEWQ